jgi:hypothetical protein
MADLPYFRPENNIFLKDCKTFSTSYHCAIHEHLFTDLWPCILSLHFKVYTIIVIQWKQITHYGNSLIY